MNEKEIKALGRTNALRVIKLMNDYGSMRFVPIQRKLKMQNMPSGLSSVLKVLISAGLVHKEVARHDYVIYRTTERMNYISSYIDFSKIK